MMIYRRYAILIILFILYSKSNMSRNNSRSNSNSSLLIQMDVPKSYHETLVGSIFVKDKVVWMVQDIQKVPDPLYISSGGFLRSVLEKYNCILFSNQGITITHEFYQFSEIEGLFQKNGYESNLPSSSSRCLMWSHGR